ncbi:fungal-specific transcription factor domain-containing protein [Trichoderma austrokoningii]
MAVNFDFGASATSPQHEHSASSPHHPNNVTIYQTTGPGAHFGPILAPGDSGSPLLNPRSCVTCRRRKVRCDKQMPCSNCRRALIPCAFPAPGRAPRQHRPKDPNAPPKPTSLREVELVKRLKKLEGIVEELSGQIEVEAAGRASSTGNSPSNEGSPTAQRPKSSSLGAFASGLVDFGDNHATGEVSESRKMRESRKQLGRLVLSDSKGTARYISSGFWSKLNDELDAIREETQKLTDEDADDSEFEESPPIDSPATAATGTSSSYNHQSFVLGHPSLDVNLKNYHPLPSHATFLWSVYRETVDPLLKIIHVPIMDALLRDTRGSPEKLAPGHESLVFAVYFAAIVALEDGEVQTNFGATKEEMLVQYRYATEQSLAKANFLNTSELAVVQALTLFLLVVRRYDESRFTWSMTALLVRIAQGLGIHRDGTNFGLSPFEIEQRRRVWWAILTLDFRASEEMGTDLLVADGDFDTQFPTNLNDADFSPASATIPAAREGRSETAITLVRFEVCAMSRRIREASGENNSSSRVESDTVAEKERMLVELYQKIEDKFLRHLNKEVDILYWVAAMISRIIMSKMCLIIYQPMLFPGSNQELTEEIRERIYIAAIEIIEYNHKLNTDPRCKQYRWLFRTYTNWSAIAYILVETCRRPWTPLVQRGWEAVNGYDKDVAENVKRADHAVVFLPLRKLFIRARRYQESEVARLRGDPEEARRLDLAERVNPPRARFDPLPGLEARQQQVRDTWRTMVQLEGSTPSSSISNPQHQQTPMTSMIPEESKPSLQHQTPAAGPHFSQSNAESQVPMGMTDDTMEYIDSFMAQNNLPMAELWNVGAMAIHNGHPAVAMAERQHVQGNIVGQEAMMLPSQQPKNDNHVPPYLWPENFATTPNQKFEMEDADMLGANFNWQDWNQSIRGLGMEGTQSKQSW